MIIARTATGAAAALVAFLCAAAPAHAIVNGTDADPDALAPRSTVALVRSDDTAFCTATLVAPDLILTAGHCIPRPGPGSIEPFRAPSVSRDWQRPDRYYPLGRDVTVHVGTIVDKPVFETTTSQYALPGVADMLLMRLAEPVPASDAVPVPILTRPPREVSDVSAWLRAQTFRVAGFGDDNDADNVDVDGDGVVDNPIASTHLNQGRFGRAVFPCTAADAHKICSQSADGSGLRTIDSGSPLYWTSPSGRRFLAGVLQAVGTTTATHIATFYRGGSSQRPAGLALSNLGGWLERTVSGRQGAAAYLRTSALEEVHISSEFGANPTGMQPRVRRVEPGDYEAVFEGLRNAPCVLLSGACAGGILPAPRVALVTASGSGSAYCKLGDAAAAARIRVRCYRPGGVLADAHFSLLTDAGGEGMMIRVPRLSAGSDAVRSDRGTVNVTWLSPGRYRVRAPLYPGPAWRNVLVSAEGPDSHRCHVASWSARSAVVRCMTASGALADSGFALVATTDRTSSYVRSESPAATIDDPAAAVAQTAGTSTRPRIHRLDRGRYRAVFNDLPANSGGNVQATAYGDVRNHCTIDDWHRASVDVACFTPAGDPADTRFVLRYVDPLDTGRRVELRLHRLRSLRSDDSCSTSGWTGKLELTGGATESVSFSVADPDRPLATIAARSRPGATFVIARLSLRDDDRDSCGGADDRVDLATGATAETASFRIGLRANTVEVLHGTPRVMGGLGTWWTDGRDGPERAMAEFSIAVS